MGNRSWREPARTEASVAQLSHKDAFISCGCYINTPLWSYLQVTSHLALQQQAAPDRPSCYSQVQVNLRSEPKYKSEVRKKNDSACSSEMARCFIRDPGKKIHSELLCTVGAASPSTYLLFLESTWLLCCHTRIFILRITWSSNLEGKR